MTKEISQTPDYRDFIRSLKQKVQSAQSQAARAVNTLLIELYWEIGKLITEKQQAAGWGDAVIDQVAQDLTRELGDIKGFSRANLYRMKKLYEFYGDDENLAQAVRQISWGHNIEIFQKGQGAREGPLVRPQDPGERLVPQRPGPPDREPAVIHQR